MNTDNVYLVLLLVLGIVVLSNLAMFAMVRGSKSMKFDWFKTANNFSEPFKKADDSLSELRKKVGDLEEKNTDPSDGTKEK